MFSKTRPLVQVAVRASATATEKITLTYSYIHPVLDVRTLRVEISMSQGKIAEGLTFSNLIGHRLSNPAREKRRARRTMRPEYLAFCANAQRTLTAIRDIPRLLFRNYNHSLLLYFLVADYSRLFLVSPAGIHRPSPLRKRIARAKDASTHDLIRRRQTDPLQRDGQKGSRTQDSLGGATYALFICAAPLKGTCSGLDFDEFNLEFAQGSERAR